MAKYTLEIQSRDLYPGPRENSMSELFVAQAHCEWSDDTESERDFDFTLESDRDRHTESVAIDTDIKAITDVTSANQYKVRNGVSIYSAPGFYGSHFKYTMQKKVPEDGAFKFFGMEFSFIPLNVDSEFFVNTGAVSNEWE